jgi:hypothetical protein
VLARVGLDELVYFYGRGICSGGCRLFFLNVALFSRGLAFSRRNSANSSSARGPLSGQRPVGVFLHLPFPAAEVGLRDTQLPRDLRGAFFALAQQIDSLKLELFYESFGVFRSCFSRGWFVISPSGRVSTVPGEGHSVLREVAERLSLSIRLPERLRVRRNAYAKGEPRTVSFGISAIQYVTLRNTARNQRVFLHRPCRWKSEERLFTKLKK